MAPRETWSNAPTASTSNTVARGSSLGRRATRWLQCQLACLAQTGEGGTLEVWHKGLSSARPTKRRRTSPTTRARMPRPLGFCSAVIRPMRIAGWRKVGMRKAAGGRSARAVLRSSSRRTRKCSLVAPDGPAAEGVGGVSKGPAARRELRRCRVQVVLQQVAPGGRKLAKSRQCGQGLWHGRREQLGRSGARPNRAGRLRNQLRARPSTASEEITASIEFSGWNERVCRPEKHARSQTKMFPAAQVQGVLKVDGVEAACLPRPCPRPPRRPRTVAAACCAVEARCCWTRSLPPAASTCAAEMAVGLRWWLWGTGGRVLVHGWL